jgi:uncharacterized membrane protein YraQ (UPF0718 family)
VAVGQATAAPRAGIPLFVIPAALVLVALVGRAAGAEDVAAIETFVLIFTSIVVEALPFVLLGALVSALIEVYVPDRVFTRWARLPLALQVPGAALGGIAFPVCECGSVPVARRLIARGMHPAAGIAFMLASPILNPIVLGATFVAYRGRGVGLEMVLGRAVMGLLVAVVAGWALAGKAGDDLLRDRQVPEPAPRPAGVARWRRAVEHLASDFFFMGKFVVLGAALAAGLQTVVPQSIVSSVARTPLVGSLALMGLAYVLSLCSEADAFVAVSFIQFPLSSQLAFLVFGPMVDVKLSFLYGATFRSRFVPRLAFVVVPVVLAGSLWFEVILR